PEEQRNGGKSESNNNRSSQRFTYPACWGHAAPWSNRCGNFDGIATRQCGSVQATTRRCRSPKDCKKHRTISSRQRWARPKSVVGSHLYRRISQLRRTKDPVANEANISSGYGD